MLEYPGVSGLILQAVQFEGPMLCTGTAYSGISIQCPRYHL